MPVNPRPADIANYNAWAARNHRPLWGAPAAAPAAAPAPPVEAPAAAPVDRHALRTAVQNGARAAWSEAAGRWYILVDGQRVWLTGPNGQKTAEGNIYYRIARGLGDPNFQLIAWRPGMHMQPGTLNEVAFTVDGRSHVVRRFNPRTGRYDATTISADYFRDHAVQFTVELPVYRVKRKISADGVVDYVRCLYGENCWLPITDDEMAAWVAENIQHVPSVAVGEGGGGIAAAGVVPAIGTPEAQRDWIRQTLARYLAHMPVIDGHRIIAPFTESDIWYAYDDTREPTFDEEVSHVRHAGPMTVQLILNRPLRGIVIVPDEMYGKTGIFPVSWEESQNGQNCVLNGLVLAINKRKCTDTRVRTRGWDNGKKITIKPEVLVGDFESSEAGPNGSCVFENVAKYTLDELTAKVDHFFEQRYPLLEQEDGSHARPDPYQQGDWRTVGVTALLVMDICNEEGIRVHILHSDKLIQTFHRTSTRQSRSLEPTTSAFASTSGPTTPSSTTAAPERAKTSKSASVTCIQ